MVKAEHTFSWQAIGRIILAMLLVFLVWKALSALINILVAIMLATALYPIVAILHKKIPLIFATLLVFLILLVPFIILGATLIPSFIREFPALITTVDNIINKSPLIPPSARNLDLTQYVQNGGTYLLNSTSLITGTITSILTVIFLTFYLIFDFKRLLAIFLSLFPKNNQQKIERLLYDLASVNGQYIRGNILISFICGIVIFIGLSILQVPYALPLAIFAGIMDLLPLIGSTLAMIPAIILGFALAPVTGFLTLLLFLLYQQAENAIISPAIYNKTLNLSPALGFLAVIIGSSLFGILGAFLALPVAASIPVIISYTRGYTDDH